MAALLSHSFPSSLPSSHLLSLSFIAAPYRCSCQMFSSSSVTPVQIIAVSTHTMARLSSPTHVSTAHPSSSSFTVAESIMKPTNNIQATNTETIADPSTQLPVPSAQILWLLIGSVTAVVALVIVTCLTVIIVMCCLKANEKKYVYYSNKHDRFMTTSIKNLPIILPLDNLCHLKTVYIVS